MKLQKATSFALYAVLELAANPEHQLAGTDIAQKYGISAHHLAKVLRDLGRAGIVDAERGVGGGYKLSANPKRLTLLDIIQVFEPVGPQAYRDGDLTTATEAGRALRLVLDELDDHTVATFQSITVSTMLKLMASQPRAHPARTRNIGRKAVSHR